MSKSTFVQSLLDDKSLEERALHEKMTKKLKESKIEILELQAKYDNLRAYLKTSQEREEKVYMDMNSQLKLSEPELKSWKEKYEKEAAEHKQDKDLLELYESQAKIQLELHKNECGSECKVRVTSLEHLSVAEFSGESARAKVYENGHKNAAAIWLDLVWNVKIWAHF